MFVNLRVVDISIHVLLAESDNINSSVTTADKISIHALLAESDAKTFEHYYNQYDFYPRSPCGERHATRQIKQTCRAISIHALLAESDLGQGPFPLFGHYFYPRSPCGERPGKSQSSGAGIRISIHALLAESDGGFGVGSWPRVIFLSTLSLRRATRLEVYKRHYLVISIHALLAESDLIPHQQKCRNGISIHALLAESDAQKRHHGSTPTDFYPRSPCGERRCPRDSRSIP